MSYIDISKLYVNVLFNISEEVLNEYGEEGVQKHLLNYIRRVCPDKIQDVGGKLTVSDELLSEEFITKYIEKDNQQDFSAKDCAVLALVRYIAPPQEYMSIGSLEKKIREIFKEHKDEVYIKRSKGKGNAICVDKSTAEKVIMLPEVSQLIKKQALKAENKHEDSVEWRAYEFAKEKLEYLESQSMEDDYNGDSGCVLLENNKTHLMVKAVYNSLFTEFDFEKYQKYQDEINELYEDWDFGERYQELYDILYNSPDYKNEFYKVNIQSDLLDALADKVADKIVEKMQKKES